MRRSRRSFASSTLPGGPAFAATAGAAGDTSDAAQQNPASLATRFNMQADEAPATATRKRVRRSSKVLREAAMHKKLDRIDYRHPYPEELDAVDRIIGMMMFSVKPPLLENLVGNRPNTTLVACALAMRRGIYRNQAEAKDMYGIPRSRHVCDVWEPKLAELERRMPTEFAAAAAAAADAAYPVTRARSRRGHRHQIYPSWTRTSSSTATSRRCRWASPSSSSVTSRPKRGPREPSWSTRRCSHSITRRPPQSAAAST